MSRLPDRAAVVRRVGCALASGLDGAERPVAERWLGGCRRLDSLVVPLAGEPAVCATCDAILEPAPSGWRCPTCEPAP